MSEGPREVQLDLFLGRRVVAAGGKRVGRLHEIVAEKDGDDLLIKEFHIGTAALLQRLSASILRLPRNINEGYRARWDQIDLSGKRPRLTCPIAELRLFSKRPAPSGR